MNIDLKSLNNRLSPEISEYFKIFSSLAHELGLHLYLVGGPVRDLILNSPILDIDLLLDSKLDQFLEVLKKRYNIRIEETEFLTAKVAWKGSLIDFAQARKESYLSSGSLPKASPGTLKDDSGRRDFTINALMLGMEKGVFVELIDYVGGISDLKKKLIRIIHKNSFLDDPTRIIRAVRYQHRFGFDIDGKTQLLIKKAIKKDVLNSLSPQRLGVEFLRSLKENKVSPILRTLFKFKAVSFLSDKIRISKGIYFLLRQWDRLNIKGDLACPWLLPLLIMCKDLNNDELENIASVLELKKIQRRILLGLKNINAADLLKKLSRTLRDEEIYDILKDIDMHHIVYLYLSGRGRGKENAGTFINRISKIKLHIDGKNIKDFGVCEGPRVGEVLGIILRAKISGELRSEEAEREYLRNIVAKINGDRISRD